MNTPFNPVRRSVRFFSAVFAGVLSVGVMAAVVNGMAAQSDGQSLGGFMASHLADQPLVATASAPRKAG